MLLGFDTIPWHSMDRIVLLDRGAVDPTGTKLYVANLPEDIQDWHSLFPGIKYMIQGCSKVPFFATKNSISFLDSQA